MSREKVYGLGPSSSTSSSPDEQMISDESDEHHLLDEYSSSSSLPGNRLLLPLYLKNVNLITI